jgi:acyl-homoserine lactone acylase PvdQ
VCLQRYSDGVNSAWKKKIPWESKVLGYGPPPWLPEDTLALARMIGYVTLQQCDFRYATESRGAFLFETFYKAWRPRPRRNHGISSTDNA